MKLRFCENHQTYFHRAKSIEDHRLYARCNARLVWKIYDAEPIEDPEIEPALPGEEVLLVMCRSAVCELELHHEIGSKDRTGRIKEKT